MKVRSTRSGARLTLFVAIVAIVLVLSAYTGLVSQQRGKLFLTLGQVATELEKDSRLISAEGGLVYEFDSNSSGLLPSLEEVGGVPTRVANLVFYSYTDETISVCGLWNLRGVAGEIEVRVPATPDGYDTATIVVIHYSPPFSYVCQPSPVSVLDATRLEFHLTVNSSGSWKGAYGFSAEPLLDAARAQPWGGVGAATITVTAVGDIYAGIYVCASVQNDVGTTGTLSLVMHSFNRNKLSNSSDDGSPVNLCGGERIAFPVASLLVSG